MIIGQERLVKQFNNLPNPFLLVGEEGMGKHHLINRLTNLPIKEITEKLSKEEIDELYLSTEPVIVLIDLNKLGISKRIDIIQNSLLKFIEEPPIGVQIIILAEYKEQVIDTIINRCHCFMFDEYTFEELNSISDNKLSALPTELAEIIRTPAEAINCNYTQLQEINNLAELIITKIKHAIVPNTLSIATKLNYGNEEEKYNINIFVRILKQHLYQHYLADGGMQCIRAFNRTKDLERDLRIINVNKQYLIHNYLLDLKGIFA